MMARSLHPVPRRAARLDARRRHLLVGCAVGATLAMAAYGDRAQAQAFNANPVTQDGSVGYSRFITPTPGSETITINSPTAIIGWNINTPAPGDPYVFLPAGNTATFQNGSGTANFAVLNRIFGSGGAPVRFDGTVISQLTDAITGITGPGGTVIFQNTGGIIVGANAVFDVGNLVLTSLSIVGDESGYGVGTFINSGGGLDFNGGVPEPYDQTITIEPGAQINAPAEGSYVVLASPRIEQGGAVRVNGNVAYVAGEVATFTVNDGIFDIVLQAGSDGNENPIIHTGSTGGPASTGPGDQHTIYMLTAPYFDGQATTMLLSGSIGYDEAVSATIENGQIILSSGFTSDSFGSPKYAEGNITITGGTFTSDVFATATRDIIATSLDGDLSFTGDFTAVGYETVRLGAVNGAVTVGGDVSLTALGEIEFGYGGGSGFGNDGFSPLGLDATGGTAEITAQNGESVIIAGNAALNASAVGEFEFDGDLDAGEGIGGTVRVQATTGGSIAIGGDLEMAATGAGAITDYVPSTGGVGQGGDAFVTAQNGSITVDGGLFIDVSGTGSRTTGSVTGTGAGGAGGIVAIDALDGTVSVAGPGTIIARGTGGAVELTDDPGTTGGEGRGGGVSVNASNGDVSFGPSTSVDVSGRGGLGPSGGTGQGGSFFAEADAGSITAGAISADVSGFGGDSNAGANGGDGLGGTARLFATDSGDIELGAVNLIADGLGGSGADADGGDGEGGTAEITAQNGGGIAIESNLSATPMISASGTGGQNNGGGDLVGGAGTGGEITVRAESGGTIDLPQNVGPLGFIRVWARGTGGAAQAADGRGGLGTGGTINMGADDGELTGALLSLSAFGQGGNSANAAADIDGGDGVGGQRFLYANNGGVLAISTAGGVAGGGGGNASGAGTGGNGFDGLARLDVDGGRVELVGALEILSQGTGGTGATAGNGAGGTAVLRVVNGGTIVSTSPNASLNVLSNGIAFGGTNFGGNGQGGTVRVEFDGVSSGSSIDATEGVFQAVGVGGDASAGTGGAGTGGRVEFGTGSAGNDWTFGNLTTDASGFGGFGVTGGAGTGGIVLVAVGGGTLDVTGTLSSEASGTGGDGTTGAGGDGTGGAATVYVNSDGALSFANAVVISDGTGGNGATGGNGTGGIQVNSPVVEPSGGSFISSFGGTVSGTSATVRSRGTGGAGASGAGGNGQGGSVGISAFNSPTPAVIELGSANLDNSATGGAGGTTSGGAGAAGGNAFAGDLNVAEANTLNGTLRIGTLASASNATGGAGGAGINGVGGRGGDAFGGFIQLGGTSGQGSGDVNGVVEFGAVTGNASATGGAGGANGGAGGNGQGGAAALLSRGGLLSVNSASFAANGTGGAGNGGAGGSGAGGEVAALLTTRFQTTIGSTNTIGSFSGVAGGTGGTGSTVGASQYGNAFIDVIGSTATFGAISLAAFGPGASSQPAPMLINVVDGQVVVTGTLDMDTPSFAGITATNGSVSVAGATTIAGQSGINIATFDESAISLAGATLNSLGAATFVADSGSIDVTGLATVRSAAFAAVATAGDIGFGSADIVVSGDGDADLEASDGGSISFSGPTTIAATDFEIALSNATLTFGGDTTITFENLTDGDDAAIRLSDGTLNIGTSLTFNAGDMVIEANGASGIQGGALTVNASRDVLVSHTARGAAPTIGVASLTVLGQTFDAAAGSVIQASSTIGINVADLATIAGTVVSPDIFIASRDIDITDTGRLGNASTTEITLSVNQQSAPTVIGGDEDEAGYTLTQAEASRISTASLEISAPTSEGPADVVIRDLTLSASPNPAGIAVNRLQISINAGEGVGGVAQVEGAVRLENATATSGIDIIAGERIQIINPAGSIRVLNSAGLPAGSIGLQSANIWSASQAIIDQLIENPNFEGRNAALLANDGDVEERGYIEAGDVLLRVGGTLFVQNSGTEEEFAGITVTQNTLTVQPTSGNVDVYAFGRRINADGSFVTNSAYFGEVDFGYGTSAYAATAEFNQCVIATGACPGDPVFPEIPIIEGSEIIEGPIEEVEDSVPPPNPDRQEFVDVSFASESLLEEAVTSGGDSGVWDGEDEQCAPGEGETCERDGGGQ